MRTWLKRADLLHTRVVEESRVRTDRGGALFLLASIASFILAVNSIWRFVSTPDFEFIERIQVDTELSMRMPIEINLTFPRLSCADVELVALDVSGEAQLDVSSDLRKSRLTADGHPVGEEIKGHLNRDKLALSEKIGKLSESKRCGSCYGAELRKDDCCTTCHDVKDRYATRGWDVQAIAREAEQCMRELDHPEIAVQLNEGCNLAGILSVNKVAGNINVALGTTRKIGGQVFHTFVQDQMGNFDTSHAILKMRFGDHNVMSDVGPLDGMNSYVDQSLGKTAAFQYFIHLVPTRINDKWTFRFTKTSKYIPVLEPEDKLEVALSTDDRKHSSSHGPKAHHQAMTLPGIYFIYDFSPFVVIRERREMLLIDLITDLLTVAGGVFALVRLLDSTLYMAGL